jgi:uncharacterized protein
MTNIVSIAILQDLVWFTLLALGLGILSYGLQRRLAPMTNWNYRGNVLTRPYEWGDAVAVGCLVAVLLSGVMMATGGEQADPMIGASASQQILLISSQMGIMLFLTSLLMVWIHFGRNLDPGELFGLRALSPHLVLPTALIFLVPTMVSVSMIGHGMDIWLKEFMPSNSAQPLVETFKASNSVLVRALLACAAVIVAPISEELIFRGMVYGLCKRFTDGWFAAIINGLLFAAVHAHVGSFLPLCVLGIILVIAYEVTGSILVPIVMHALFNGTMIGIMLLT